MHFHSASDYRVYRESILELIDRKDFLNFQGDSDSALIVSLLKKLFFFYSLEFQKLKFPPDVLFLSWAKERKWSTVKIMWGFWVFSSVAQSCLILCNPMDCSTPGLSVHHQLLEFTQTHVHWIGDAIQPSHPLSSPSPPALNLFQHQGLFKWVSSSHQVAKVLEFQLQISLIYIYT